MRKRLLFIILFQSLFGSAQCWQSVSPGSSHTLAIRNGGSLWVWGRNNFGQLGTAGVPANQSTFPIQVGNDTDWSKISAGSSHCVAIKTDGTLWTWGKNDLGQLGNNSTVNSNIPIQIGTDTDWAFISAGDNFNLALKSNGTLWAWGDNANGQLGNGSGGAGNKILIPTQIGSVIWSSVSAGTDHSLAIKPDGTMWAWGRNNNGKLGNSTTTDSFTPIQIGTSNTWETVLASQAHSVGKMTDGTVWTWGDNTSGQLGDGTSGAAAYKTSPINIGSVSISTKIGKGYQHTIVRKNDGRLYSWGGNVSGQLGDGTNTQKTSPVLVNNETDWDYIDAKATHTIALKNDGSLYTWGNNLYGQLGINNNSAQNTPQLVMCPNLDAENFSITKKLKVFPNPAQNNISFVTDEFVSFSAIKITDLTGKIIFSTTENSKEITVENLTSGIYFIEAKTKEEVYKAKFIKI